MSKKKVVVISIILAMIVVAVIIILAVKINKQSTITSTMEQERKTLNSNKNAVTIEREAKVKDNIAPTITLKGEKEKIINIGEQYQDEGCIAQDNCDGDITSKVNITGKVDTKKEGNYTILYQVQDCSGNKVEETRNVKVKKKSETTTHKDTTKTVTTSTTPNNQVNKSKKGLPVLMYHFFYDAKKKEKGKDNNWMEISTFEQQMKYLADNNYYFPSWSEVEDFIEGKKTLPQKSVVITIDDGDETFIKYAIPIIEKYNVKATSFVVTSWNGDWLPKQYRSTKMDFQSHSHDMHRPGANGKGRLINVSQKEALEDVTKSKNILENCSVFCYPFGHYNNTTIKILKEAGYKLAFTTKNGRVYPGANKYELPRIRMSKEMNMSAFKEAVK